jgi:hypothetical protein
MDELFYAQHDDLLKASQEALEVLEDAGFEGVICAGKIDGDQYITRFRLGADCEEHLFMMMTQVIHMFILKYDIENAEDLMKLMEEFSEVEIDGESNIEKC